MKLITFDEFVKFLKSNSNTVKTWKRRGDLPAKIFLKIGGTIYVLQDKFEQWVAEKQASVGDYYGDL